MHRAIHLVVTPLKNIDFTAFKIEESFFPWNNLLYRKYF